MNETQDLIPASRSRAGAEKTTSPALGDGEAPKTAQIRNKPVSRFRIGDRVRLERDKPARGSWHQYAGKVGTVVAGESLGEIGVSFSPSGGGGSDAYFLPTELTKIGHVPPKPRPAKEDS